ncbi:polysaccharide export protein [candidate division KSB1 bacterium]|nr:polysaccharide export protein [candidate division KSB1 bacterium]RQW01546.1 MAG: polysaccharide export protein [candidate division KSB1 bacterium]
MSRVTGTLAFCTSIWLSCAINPNLQEINTSPAKVKIQIPHNRETMAKVNKSAGPREYHLGYGDVVEIKFFHNAEYNDVVAVRPDGKLTLQRLGDIDVAGMRVTQLDSIITSNYSEILVNPDVTVFVREFGGHYVYVLGEVQHPGSYNITKGMSILRAIATAGGPLFSAKMNSIILIRSDEQKNLTAERINLLPSNFETLLNNDMQVLPYDLVYVPRTFVADLESFVTQIYKIVMPPLELATRFYYYNAIR